MGIFKDIKEIKRLLDNINDRLHWHDIGFTNRISENENIISHKIFMQTKELQDTIGEDVLELHNSVNEISDMLAKQTNRKVDDVEYVNSMNQSVRRFGDCVLVDGPNTATNDITMSQSITSKDDQPTKSDENFLYIYIIWSNWHTDNKFEIEDSHLLGHSLFIKMKGVSKDVYSGSGFFGCRMGDRKSIEIPNFEYTHYITSMGSINVNFPTNLFELSFIKKNDEIRFKVSPDGKVEVIEE